MTRKYRLERDVCASGFCRLPPGRPAGPGEVGQSGEQRHRPSARSQLANIRGQNSRRAARQAWTQQPLPPAQSELLRLAAARPGLTVAEAAQELRLAPNTISKLVGRLADAGLLNRERSARDGRTALLTTTDKANRRLAEFRDLRAELAGRALVRLAEQDRQALARAVPALLRLAERMEAPSASRSGGAAPGLRSHGEPEGRKSAPQASGNTERATREGGASKAPPGEREAQ